MTQIPCEAIQTLEIASCECYHLIQIEREYFYDE